MKKILSIMAIVATAFGFASCSSSDSVPLSDLTVTLSIPTEVNGFTVDAELAGIEVTLTNIVDNTTSTIMTDGAGVATFIDLAAGGYTVAASTEAADGVNKINLVGSAPVTLVAGEDGTYTLPLVGSVKQDDLIISEICMTSAGYFPLQLMECKFFEIYNNTDHALTTEGLLFACVGGRVGTSDNDRLWSTTLPIGEKIYIKNLVRFPSDKVITLQPGEGLVVASNAVDYTEGDATSVHHDLSGAAFECHSTPYMQSLGGVGSATFDTNNENVDDIEILYMYNQGNDYSWLNWATVGESYVLIRDTDFVMSASLLVEEPEDTANPKTQYVTIDANTVIDGVCMVGNSEAADFVNLPATIDGSFTYYKADGNPLGSGISIARKKDAAASTAAGRTILVDTNDSANDFDRLSSGTPFVYGE